ncbi:transcription factor sum-1 [Plakobranchus ocellatus]|uniref:Transcription factor sum-1 n=1 Tax=Plakobranchus ocellatus TaxID=259542 RepID=A0AAV4CNN3_9GAST|nr:transcription factor sum-1 [Plakobranchus ocellatus]
MISGFQALRQARAPVSELELAKEVFLQSQGGFAIHVPPTLRDEMRKPVYDLIWPGLSTPGVRRPCLSGLPSRPRPELGAPAATTGEQNTKKQEEEKQ